MKQINLTKLIRADISKMEPYVPVLSLWDLTEKFNVSEKEILKLDQGENPYGLLPNVAKALRQTDFFNYYPDPEYKRLRKAISEFVGVKPENIMVGAGADELLDLILRLILNEEDEVINCPPTFGMYPVLIQLNKGKAVSIPRKSDYSLDIKEILKKINRRTKAIFICSPNNPTGNIVTDEEIIPLLQTEKLIIADEAYFEFSGKTLIPLLKKYKNLIVLRTFSKWAGLAGIRLGYGVMDSFLTQQILKIKPPFNVNLAAETAGIAAINNFTSAKEIIKITIQEREKMFQKLSKIPYLKVYPSKGNFLFLKIGNDLLKLKSYLESKKIIVRYYNPEGALRLSIGKPEQNNLVLNALKEFKNEN